MQEFYQDHLSKTFKVWAVSPHLSVDTAIYTHVYIPFSLFLIKSEDQNLKFWKSSAFLGFKKVSENLSVYFDGYVEVELL